MNKRIVQNIYAAFKNKDIQSIIDLQAENAEWLVSASPDKIPWASPGRGPKGVANFFKTLSELLATDAFDINEYVECGNKVIAFGYQAGYVKSTGDHYEYDFVHVWELKNGKVVKFHSYFDTAYVAAALAGDPKTAV